MWDFSVGQSLALMGRTMPFILFRLVVYVGIAIAYVLATGVGAGVGFGVGSFWGADGQAGGVIWGAILGFGLTAAVLYFLREYILYIVKAGHIAVLVELIDGRDVPEGRSQIEHATAVVKSRFVEASVLFAIDQLVKGVLRAVIGLAQGLAALLPIPGLQQVIGLVRVFLQIAVGFVDEVILAYAIRTNAANPWQSAQTALVLYAQNYKPMLRNAAWLVVITYGLSILVFVAMLVPAGAIVAIFQNGWGAASIVFAIVFAWAVKAAVLEPFAICCMMQAYFKAIEGQTPDPEWDAKLTSVSRKFKEIKDKAAAGLGGNFGGGWQKPPPASSTGPAA